MITVQLVGDAALIAKLSRFPANLQMVLYRRVSALVLKLKARVQRKLSGQVLRVISGALRRSIQSEVDRSPRGVIGRVFSTGDVKYAGIHEHGGKTRAHIIEPRKAAALSFLIGGNRVFAKRVHHPGSRMPERSFMRSSMREMRHAIIAELSDGIMEAGLGRVTR